MVKFNIFDELNLDDVLLTVSHNYDLDEQYPTLIGHNIVANGFEKYEITGEQLKDILKHLSDYTLDGKPIEEVNLHRYQVDTDANGPVYQTEVVLYNKQ